MPLYRRPVAAFFGMASGARTAPELQGWTQGSRPCSSSAMILSVISWYRLERAAGDVRAMAELRDRTARSLSPDLSTQSRTSLSLLPLTSMAQGALALASPPPLW